METNPKLLLVDDETAITDRLAPFLSRAGFDVKVAADGEAALNEIVSYTPDLIVLDVLMPRLDGREVLRQLRQKGDWTPIILLTQVGESAERAMALMEGADDYINKPFDPNELAARIKTVLRRASPGQPPLSVAERLRRGDLVVDRTKRRAYLETVEVDLSPKAMSLLEYMVTHPDELLSRDRLLDAVWGWSLVTWHAPLSPYSMAREVANWSSGGSGENSLILETLLALQIKPDQVIILVKDACIEMMLTE